MTNLLNEEKINYFSKLLHTVKLLSKDFTFLANLVPAIALTILVPVAIAPKLLTVIGAITGILNWGVVIWMLSEAIKRKH